MMENNKVVCDRKRKKKGGGEKLIHCKTHTNIYIYKCRITQNPTKEIEQNRKQTKFY